MITPLILREQAEEHFNEDPFDEFEVGMYKLLVETADRLEQLEAGRDKMMVYSEMPREAEADKQPSSRERLPDTRSSVTHRFKINTHKGYVTVGFYEDGRPGELFIEMAKEGSTVGGLCDAIGILTSIALQRGVPLEELVRKFQGTSFEPSGPTMNKDQDQASSIMDYVFVWLGRNYVPGFQAEYGRLQEVRKQNAG